MKTYTIKIREDEMQSIKSDIILKGMGGKLEHDVTARIIGKLINDQLVKKGVKL